MMGMGRAVCSLICLEVPLFNAFKLIVVIIDADKGG